MALPWIIISIAIGIVLAALAAVFFFKIKKKKRETDYRTFFMMGVVWVPLGVVFWIIYESIVFLAMGVVFLAIGLANKDKWGKPVKLTPEQRKRNMLLGVIGVTVLVIAVLLTFFLLPLW